MTKGIGPQQWANIAGRKNSARALRRAAEARAAKELQDNYLGLSLPAAKKLLRRRKPK